MIVVIVVLFLLGLVAQGALLIYLSGRADRADRRQAEAIEGLARTEQQRHLDSLQLQRARLLEGVHVDAQDAVPKLEKILSAALLRPVRVFSIITVSAAPVPAIVFDTGKEETILTTSAEAYTSQVLLPTRRLAKGQRVENVSILPGLEQLVVDEEVYQCYCHIADQFHVDATAVPKVQVWQAIVLPRNLADAKGRAASGPMASNPTLLAKLDATPSDKHIGSEALLANHQETRSLNHVA